MFVACREIIIFALMKRLIYLLCCFICVTSLPAQTVAEMFMSMPSKMISYVTDDVRNQLVGSYGNEEDSKKATIFGDSICIDLLTTDFLSIQLSQARRLQMKMLPLGDSDTIVCVVSTFYGPAAESTIQFYNCQWQPLNLSESMPVFNVEMLTQCPDDMSQQTFEDLKALIDPCLYEYKLSPENTDIEILLSYAMTNREDRVKLKSIAKPCRLQWQKDLGRFL